MSQSKLQQFYTVRKRFHTEHAITSAKRRKTDPNLDIPAVGAGCEDGSFAATSQETPTPSSQETPTPSSQETPTPSSQETPTPSASTSAVEDTHRPSKQPTYQRLHFLTQPTEAILPKKVTHELPTPYNYQVLSEKFRSTDIVVNMLQMRKEICTFDKLKPAVEQMTRRKYEVRNLGQMKMVHPDAFIFRQEKRIPGVYDRKKYESYQLSIECNVNERGRPKREEEEEEKEEKRRGSGKKGLESSDLLRRRKYFNQNLIELVKTHHKSFLSSLSPPLSIPDEKVLRWHPDFQLDSVPDVPAAQLPSPPHSESYSTAQDVLNATQDRLAPRVRQILTGVAANTAESGTGRKRESEDGDMEGRGGEEGLEESAVKVNPGLRGVSQKLLEKIQQKEATRARATITRDPAKEKKLEMLHRLPAMCRIIRTFFVSEKKAALPWDRVIVKLCESHSSGLPPDRVEEHLSLLLSSAPNWIQVFEIRKKRFVKIKIGTELQSIVTKLETVHKDLVA